MRLAYPHSTQRGYILLPVVLFITVIATITFLVNNDTSITGNITAAETVAERADQVAKAGLAHASWGAQNSGCAGDMGMTTVPFGQGGTGSYSATVTTPGGTTTAYPNLAVDQDAWFRSDDITVNKGTDVTSHLRRESGDLEYVLTRFDLSSLPAGAQINSATAWFYVQAAKGHPEGPVSVHRVTADWTETGATWESMSSNFDSAILQTIPAQPAAGGVWVAVNLTAQVQAWVNGSPNYGIMLIPTGEGTHAEYISREGTASKRPRLDVIVGNGPASPATIQVTGTLAGNPSPANDITRTLTRIDVSADQPGSYTSLQPGAASGKDAEIWDQAPNNNYGDEKETWVSSASNDTTRTLLRFNMGAIPAGAKILEATLSLQHSSGSGADQPVSAHRIRNPWSEDAVTWNSRETGTNWDTAGGDFDNTAVATTPVGPGNQRYAWDITPLVQGWVDGSYPNNGVVLVAAIAGMAGERFYTSDEPQLDRRPSLSVIYACECGTPCMAPQGKGKVLMPASSSSNPNPSEVRIIELLESWGYVVQPYWAKNSQSNYNAAIAANDVVFVPATANANDVGTKLTNASIGVVSGNGALNDELGIASGYASPVGSTINISDNSHYITLPFASGPLNIYSAAMEGLAVAGTPEPGLQTLGDWSGSGGPVVLEEGTPLAGGGTAAGRRVLLPIGGSNIDLAHINNNGRLMMQRALAWGMKADFVSIGNVLLVVGNPGSLTAQEDVKKALVESWDYTVNLIDESDSQANFDAAIAANDVAYIPQDINSSNLGTKLVDATIGVVNEEGEQVDELGFASDKLFKNRHEIDIVDNSHYITQPFATGLLTFVASDQSVHMLMSSLAPGLSTLAQSSNVGSQWEPSLGVIETGGDLSGGGTAAGRRVELPWGGGTFDINQLNADGQTIMQRAIEWAEGAGSGPASGLNVLLVVGDATTLASKDVGYKALIESWGHTVTLIDDGDSQANFDAAAAANDVVYVSGSSSGPSLGDKLTNTTKGLVNEVNGKLDNFGFSSSTSATANFDTFSTTNAAHYITESFSGNPVTVFNSTLTNPVPGGTLAPDLSNVGEVSGTLALGTLDAGATRYDSNPSQGRRAHLPFTAAETTDMTADGKTILQRTLEWAAGAGAGAATLPIAHWKFDEGIGPTAFDTVGGNDATLNGDPAWTTGTLGGALDFDGSGDYVTTDSNFTPPPIGTVTFWMQVSGSPAAHGRVLGLDDTWEIRHVTTGTPDGIPYGLVFDLGLTGVNTEFVTTTTIDTPGQWYHIAASYDTTNDAYAVYIDGVPHKSGTYPSALAVPAANLLSIGTRTGSTNYFDGVLDDVRIYDQFLSPAEIADLAAGGGGGGGGGGSGSPVYEEFTEAALGSNGTSLAIGKPSGTAAGDLLVAAVATDGNNSGSLAPPAGWNVIHVANRAGKVTFGIWWKLAGASEPGSYTFTWSSSERAYGWIMRFTGHDPGNPIPVDSNAAGKNAAPSSPSVTTTVDNALILRLGGFDDDDITAGDPGLSGHTAINMGESDSSTSSASGGAGYVLQATAGDSGTSSFALTASEEYVSVTLAIAPAP